MTEPFQQGVTVHGLVSGLGIGIGELNKDMWEPLPLEPAADGAAPEGSPRPDRPPATTRR